MGDNCLALRKAGGLAGESGECYYRVIPIKIMECSNGAEKSSKKEKNETL
jgi:hypothetical protein